MGKDWTRELVIFVALLIRYPDSHNVKIEAQLLLDQISQQYTDATD